MRHHGGGGTHLLVAAMTEKHEHKRRRPLFTDPRVAKTTAIITVVACGILIGYLSAQASHSGQDWLLLTSMTVILVCSFFVMINDIWKQNA
jgi:uncharacterized membrane protein YkgB